MLCNTAGLGSCAFARHYLRNHFCFLFLRVMRCFSSPGLPYALHSTDIAVSGFPHSDIRGSMCICHSPRLFAAYHVLLRLQEPRHPSCALFSFLFSFAFWYYSYILWVKSLYTLAFVSLHFWNSTLCLDFLLFFLASNMSMSSFLMWRITDSNRWPPACKAGALASWANPPCLIDRSISIRLQ